MADKGSKLSVVQQRLRCQQGVVLIVTNAGGEVKVGP